MSDPAPLATELDRPPPPKEGMHCRFCGEVAGFKPCVVCGDLLPAARLQLKLLREIRDLLRGIEADEK